VIAAHRTRKPRRKADYRLERLDSEILLYHPAKTKALHLNETASIIWTLCDGSRTTGQIIALLREGFPDQAGVIADEVESSLQLFVEHGAVEFA
jgi:hypothetical protein